MLKSVLWFGSGSDIVLVRLADDVRAGEVEQVVVAFQGDGMVGEPFASEIGFRQSVLLQDGACGPVQN